MLKKEKEVWDLPFQTGFSLSALLVLMCGHVCTSSFWGYSSLSGQMEELNAAVAYWTVFPLWRLLPSVFLVMQMDSQAVVRTWQHWSSSSRSLQSRCCTPSEVYAFPPGWDAFSHPASSPLPWNLTSAFLGTRWVSRGLTQHLQHHRTKGFVSWTISSSGSHGTIVLGSRVWQLIICVNLVTRLCGVQT
jgi:hypothetical protein